MPKAGHVMETPTAYIPMDRRQALALGQELPDRLFGATLFADISGFTPLTEELVSQLGPQRGAEELTIHLNRVYDALITELHRYGGSVISFSGDAITCWFDGDSGLQATASALAMQRAMRRFVEVTIPSGKMVSLAMKAAVATGAVRRFVVGDPQLQLIDVLAGATLDHLASAEHHAGKGEVVLDPAAVTSLAGKVQIIEWRRDDETGERFGLVGDLLDHASSITWPSLPPDALSEKHVRPWLLPVVFERLRSGQGEFLAELRPAVALFLRFSGIDFDRDEAAGPKLDAFIRQVQHILARYEGALLQLTMGDKGSYLYAVFGAPLAHEDDTIRAVAAALELRSLESDCVDTVQIGISQGRFRAGAYGGTMRRTYGVLGDEVNLAARLMQAAAPGQVLVSDISHRAAGDVFTWESLPPLKVKGKSEPVTVFNLVREKKRRGIRLQAMEYALPMVGREAELLLIQQKLDLALQGRGQLVGITGEAGLGKTRLIAEAVRLAGARQLAAFVSECESYGTNTSYLVWRAIWRDFFDLDPTWETDKQVGVLEKRLESIAPALVPRMPLLGTVLNLPIPDNDLTSSLDSKLRKSSLEALLVDCLRAWAGTTPLLLVLEDCHWLDPLSHDLLEVLGRALADLPVLLLLAYRPPEVDRLQSPRVSRLAHFVEIALTEFTPQEAERLIDLKLSQFVGSQAEVSPAFVKLVTARAEGNPFYIEELLNYLRDRDISPRDIAALEELDLPTSLHSLIISRLDQRSESQKITLRVASVVGRLFRAALLWGVYPELGTSERVKADLDALCYLDLTRVDTPEPELAYFFKHIVTQEVAYESLPYATRAMLHEQLAEYIEHTYSEALTQYVDLLAYHYGRSQNEDKKREYLRKAGEMAQADYANEAAMNYYERLLPLLPPAEQADIMLKLGQVLQLVGKWREAGDLYQQSLALAEQLDDRPAQAWCQAAMGELLGWKQGQYLEASTWLERARAGFEESGDQTGVAHVLKLAGTLAAQQGDLDAAHRLWTESLTIGREMGDKPNIARLLSNLGIVARMRGDYQAARLLHQEALTLRTELGDKWAIANSLNNLGNVYLDQGDYLEARARLEEAVGIQREIGDRYAIANALHSLANVTRDQGDYPASRAQYEESMTALWGLGELWLLAHLLEDMGGLAALQGQPERALQLVGAAAALRESIGAPLSPAYQDKLDIMLEPAREVLGEAAVASARAAGKAMSLEQAVGFALGAG